MALFDVVHPGRATAEGKSEEFSPDCVDKSIDQETWMQMNKNKALYPVESCLDACPTLRDDSPLVVLLLVLPSGYTKHFLWTSRSFRLWFPFPLTSCVAVLIGCTQKINALTASDSSPWLSDAQGTMALAIMVWILEKIQQALCEASHVRSIPSMEI